MPELTASKRMPLELTQENWLLAQSSLKFFMMRALGIQWWPDHYAAWYRDVEENDRTKQECARGHGKSIFWSYGYLLWRIIRGQWEGILISYSEDQVRRLLRDVRLEVENNPFLEPVRPRTKDLWGTDLLTFPDGSALKGLGFGTASRGAHPNDIVVDDPLKDFGGLSAEDQERAFFGVIEGMAMPTTRLNVVGTPVAFGDLFTKLDSNPVYKCRKFPAYKSEGTPLFPELWNHENLQRKKAIMGSINFAREYMLERIDPETQIFKKQFETLYEEIPTRFAHVVTVCDPAYSEQEGDQTAIVTIGLTHGNHAYVLEAKGLRREDPGKIIDELFRTIRTWQSNVVGIEKRKGDAISFSFNERRVRDSFWSFKYVELPPGHGKNDQYRIGGLTPRWEARAIHLHRNQTDLLQQLYEYRESDAHDHDDLVDALAYCFHPDMLQPNAGKQFAMGDGADFLEGRPLYQPGRASFAEADYDMILGRRKVA